jgi:hypothetical protein
LNIFTLLLHFFHSFLHSSFVIPFLQALLQCDFKHAVAGARALTAQKSSRDLDRLLAAYLHVAELARASVPFLSACVRAEVDATGASSLSLSLTFLVCFEFICRSMFVS